MLSHILNLNVSGPFCLPQHRIASPSVFLTTEDPVALAEFLQAAPKSWHRVFVYTPAVSADSSVHSQAIEAQSNSGATGRHALVALLLALEARFFVLTGASNWSRLIDELRRTMLEVDCALLQVLAAGSPAAEASLDACATDVIDLQPHSKFVKHGFLRPVTDTHAIDPIKGFLNTPQTPVVNETAAAAIAARRLGNAIDDAEAGEAGAAAGAAAALPAAAVIETSLAARRFEAAPPAAASPRNQTTTAHQESHSGGWRRVGGAAAPPGPRPGHTRGGLRSRRLQEQELPRSSSAAREHLADHSGHAEHSAHGGSCSCAFLTYTPAPIETRWAANIEAWQVRVRYLSRSKERSAIRERSR